MNTHFSRANQFCSIFLSALLSLLALSGLSLYIVNINARTPVSAHHSGLLFSNHTQWRIATPAENNAVDQSSRYFGTSHQTLQEILPTPMAVGIDKVSSVIKTGLQTGQKMLAYSAAYPFNLSAVLLNELPIASAQASAHKQPAATKTPNAASLATHLKLTSSEQRLTPELYSQLQNIFKNEVYLNPHAQQNQRFSLIYDHSGRILLAAVTVRHKTYQAIRYTDSSGHTGYYTPSGAALFKSLFLTAPLKYSRISDGFTLHRWHPILHIVRPHYGIDYAAPAGTPIRAIASGRVSFAGMEGGYGRAIVIRHNDRFQSLYAHLSRYAIKSGQWVNQGEVIGYVGSSGLATGPHLHFGLYEYGKPINPASVLPRLQAPTRIAQRDLPDFLAKTNHLLSQLALLQNHNLANG